MTTDPAASPARGQALHAAETPAFAWGVGVDTEGRAAAETAAREAAERLNARPDLAFVFFSPAHAAEAGEVASAVRGGSGVRDLVGVSGGAVIAAGYELEDRAAVSVLLARLPGCSVRVFTPDDLHAAADAPEEDAAGDGGPADPDEDDAAADPALAALAGVTGVGRDTRCMVLLADPFSVPITGMLRTIDRARRAFAPGMAVVGGMASSARSPGGNALLAGGRVLSSGAVGVTISGPLRVDTVVSQGCRAVGPEFIITAAKGNLVMGLGGKPALEAIRDAAEAFSEEERALLKNGLLLGRVVNEYKDRFGRGDYLIRGIAGVDEPSGSVAVGEQVRVGQTVRLHVRDAQTATEDLELLLDGQQLHGPPLGGLLFTCNGRGRALFGQHDRDASAVQRAFTPGPPGEIAAKAGKDIELKGGATVPLAGFFAAGEIGPIGGVPHLHGHTASLALFRAAGERSGDASAG